LYCWAKDKVEDSNIVVAIKSIECTSVLISKAMNEVNA